MLSKEISEEQSLILFEGVSMKMKIVQLSCSVTNKKKVHYNFSQKL